MADETQPSSTQLGRPWYEVQAAQQRQQPQAPEASEPAPDAQQPPANDEQPRYTYGEMLAFLQTLSPEQLAQQAFVCSDGYEKRIISIEALAEPMMNGAEVMWPAGSVLVGAQ